MLLLLWYNRKCKNISDFLLRNTRCNSIRGATEGTVFPSKMDKRAVFRVFRKAFCRPVPIVYEKNVDMNGLSGYQYTIPDNFADPPELNPDNECFCREKECLKRGLMDLTPCYYSEYFSITFLNTRRWNVIVADIDFGEEINSLTKVNKWLSSKRLFVEDSPDKNRRFNFIKKNFRSVL